MEHYLTKIIIDKVRHLRNIEISIAEDQRRHLILTGKNGSGKTSVLEALEAYVKALNDGNLNGFKRISDSKISGKPLYEYETEIYARYYQGIRVEWNDESQLEESFDNGDLITAYFPAGRKYNMEAVNGVENVKLEMAYSADADPSAKLLKYMVHLKTQQSYAQNEQDESIRESIGQWFARFENALKKLLDDDSIVLKYDYRNYNFLIIQDGKEPFELYLVSCYGE